jgi:hypothetical protein
MRQGNEDKMFYIYKPPRPAADVKRACSMGGFAKKPEEACFRSSPDGNFTCGKLYEGFDTEHLHMALDDKGNELAEWFSTDTMGEEISGDE